MAFDQAYNINSWQSGFCHETWLNDRLTNGHGDGEADGYCVVDSFDNECVGDGDGKGIVLDYFNDEIFYIESDI